MLVDAEAALGPLTTLINNAGVSSERRGDLLEVTPESYDRCQAVNSRGSFSWRRPGPGACSSASGPANFTIA